MNDVREKPGEASQYISINTQYPNHIYTKPLLPNDSPALRTQSSIEDLVINATHASGKVLGAWKDRCRPYSINILTLLGETLSSGVDKHLETKVLDTGPVKMKDKSDQSRALLLCEM